MSTRKIAHWGKNAGEAFGRTGYKGVKGEHWFADYYFTKGFEVQLFEEDRSHQLAGVDVIITNESSSYTIDVKNNLRKDNSFYVELESDGWLFNPDYVNDYVSHVNPGTGVIATYVRKRMQKFIKENYPNCKGEILLLHKEDEGLDFIRWTFTKDSA